MVRRIYVPEISLLQTESRAPDCGYYSPSGSLSVVTHIHNLVH